MPSLELTPDPASPGAARRFVISVLRGWDVDQGTIDDAALLATELVTNAVIHARTDVWIDVAMDASRIHIAVSDSNPGRPEIRRQDHAASTGRGLYLLDQLASDWRVVYGDGSKTVMCSLGTGADR